MHGFTSLPPLFVQECDTYDNIDSAVYLQMAQAAADVLNVGVKLAHSVLVGVFCYCCTVHNPSLLNVRTYMCTNCMYHIGQ